MSVGPRSYGSRMNRNHTGQTTTSSRLPDRIRRAMTTVDDPTTAPMERVIACEVLIRYFQAVRAEALAQIDAIPPGFRRHASSPSRGSRSVGARAL